MAAALFFRYAGRIVPILCQLQQQAEKRFVSWTASLQALHQTLNPKPWHDMLQALSSEKTLQQALHSTLYVSD